MDTHYERTALAVLPSLIGTGRLAPERPVPGLLVDTV